MRQVKSGQAGVQPTAQITRKAHSTKAGTKLVQDQARQDINLRPVSQSAGQDCSWAKHHC